MNEFLISILTSPVTGKELIFAENSLQDKEKNFFPIIKGVPVLINNEKSIFNTNTYLQKSKIIVAKKSLKNKIKSKILNFLVISKPSITLNPISKKNYQKIFYDLKEKTSPTILIVGSGEADGVGLDSSDLNKVTKIIKTDIVYSNYVDVICDAHNLPFKNGTFDAVIIQAVLEHVIDPKTCVNEIHRVLKEDGLVYAETPFMQQVHLGRYDFTRFTHLGHRRLFNNFSEISSGPVCGPASALNWSIKYFFRSFFQASFAQFFFEWVSTFFYFWLKYFDYFLIKKQGAYDSSSGYFFYGVKQRFLISDNDIVKDYKGIISA